MTEKEALDAQLAWRDLCIAGPKDRIDQFLAELDRIAEQKGWSRDTEAEERLQIRYQTRAELRSYARVFAEHPVTLLFWRRGDRRVDTWLAGAPTAPESQRQALVAEACIAFRRDCIDPSAQTANLQVGRHSLGPHSLVPNWIIDALWSLYEVSAFQWPPTGKALEQWREFVITVYQNNAAFDPRELKRWLIEKGWSEADADRLIEQKDADATLLGAYEDALQTA